MAATGLRLAPGIAAVPVENVGVFLLGERGQWLATVPALVGLLPLLDGNRDADALLASLPPGDRAHGAHALDALLRAGVAGLFPPPEPPPPAAAPLAAPGRFLLAGDDARGLGLLADALRRVGVAFADATAPPAGLPRVLVVLDPLGPEATRLIDAAAADGVPALPVKLAGARAFFGPSLAPGEAPRLRAALAQARPVEAWLARHAGRPFGLPPEPPSAAGAALAPLLAARLAAGGLAADALEEWTPEGLGRHRLPPTGPAPAAGPPRFDPALPARSRAGGTRLRDPGEVATVLAPPVSDLLGPIAAIGPLDAGPGRHVWAGTTRLLPRDAHPAPDAFHGVCLGKGRDAAQARASLLGEAVERLSALWRDDDCAVFATAADLGPDAIPPETLWGFSPAQYAARAAWNAATADPRRQVPDPPGPDRPIAWVRAWSLGARAWRWLPRDQCYANAPEPRCGRFNPNGHAAGACLEEAVLQAFLELVERDAVAIWWYNRMPRPGLAPDGPLLPLARGLAAQGWQIWLLDLTTDLGIPCRAALARADSDGRWAIGFGAHLDAAIASERAMTELVQLFRADGRDGPPPWTPGGDAPHLFPHGRAKPTDAATSATTLAGLIDWCRDRAAALGLDMLVLDQTRPDLGLFAAKVVVPGLRHFWPRFGPGRLYDVPVALGWRAAPLAETDLNPVHLFL